jgi:hypothetical protein
LTLLLAAAHERLTGGQNALDLGDLLTRATSKINF